MLQPNQLLQGRYRVQRKLAEGGQSVVYLARDERLGRDVAVKEFDVVSVKPADLQDALRQFAKAAGILAALNHAGIAQIFDAFDENSVPYIVTEYVDGNTLEEGVLAQPGGVPEAQVLQWAEQLCDVLTYLHSQHPPVIFRDLKPHNVMVTRGGRIKLIDFGIARTFKVGKSLDTESFGTPGYAPPEQFGTMQTGPYSDVYALGATLLRLLTGYEPDIPLPIFPRADALKQGINPTLANAIAQATQRHIADRFATVEAFRTAIQQPTHAPTAPMPANLPNAPPAMIVAPAAPHNTPAQKQPTRPFVVALGGIGFIALFLIVGLLALMALGVWQWPTFTSAAQAPATPSPSTPLPAPLPTVGPAKAAAMAGPAQDPTVVVETPLPTNTPPTSTFTPLPPTFAPESPTATPIPATLTPEPTKTLAPLTPVPACADSSPFGLSMALMERLGCPTADFVPSRLIVTQAFDRGFMIMFTNENNGFGSEALPAYALANDGRAWRIKRTWSQSPDVSANPNAASQYSCMAPAGDIRPEQSGIPWRGFGKVWCDSTAVRQVLGGVRPGAAEILEQAAFQTYDRGRAFAFGGRTYVMIFTASSLTVANTNRDLKGIWITP